MKTGSYFLTKNRMDTFEAYSQQNGILRFIVPPFARSKVVLSINHNVQLSYFHSYDCPGYIFMCEEYQLPSPSFFTCVLEATGRRLKVLSCTEYNRSGRTVFNRGYEYIRMPADTGCTENWEYQLNKMISISCMSRLSTREIDGLTCRELQVERRTIYHDGITSSESLVREHYVAGIGITEITYGEEQDKQ